MNKQQLAAKIWTSANDMRWSKIENNEYKDYLLGFIFYKYISEKEEKWLLSRDYTPEDIQQYVNEKETETVASAQQKLGYFIAYENLFSTWIAMGSDFSIDNVRIALSSFDRLISPSHKKVFEGIFTTLETGLSKLGENTRNQTKAVSDLIHLVDEIPMDGKQDYDVLGFVYEYLIGQFAANAGKKAGEFYTPHEVSLLMAHLIAYHLRDRKEIKIYDPTSGSGSLLINIGRAISKYTDPNHIKYYAQELKVNTYNLTRMNLVMRGILPDNIVTRNGDTLDEDWPYFDENDPVGTYDPLFVDGVVSNPPYSQHWAPKGKDNDPRFAGYGLAPKSKADFAFLLHDLYHLKPDGMMTIVLPHGVLFRGNEEEQVRRNLIEKNQIDAIIGLPANIFFGTSIPTIVMVLRKQRPTTDVLIVDASKGFTKEGKNNKLRACDIRRIVDTVIQRRDVPHYSRKVSKEEIQKNGYNLNIPRYVDSSDEAETWDLYASMFGGIPEAELDKLSAYWDVFPTLKAELFTSDGQYAHLKTEDSKAVMMGNGGVRDFLYTYHQAFSSMPSFLTEELVARKETLSPAKTEDILTADLFARFHKVPLVDPYDGYEIFHSAYDKISGDIEIIQTEGKEALRQIDPRMVKKNGKEVQEGYEGHLLPFDIVQRNFLTGELQRLEELRASLAELDAKAEEIMDDMGDDEKENLLNNDNTDFSSADVKKALSDAFADVETEDIKTLRTYLTLSKKNDKVAFTAAHPLAVWKDMKPNKDGVTYGKTAVNGAIKNLQLSYQFSEGTPESRVVEASRLIARRTDLKSRIQQAEADLQQHTIDTIHGLSDEDVDLVLQQKWVMPVANGIAALADTELETLGKKIAALSEKYEDTYADIEQGLRETGVSLSSMMGELTGNATDMAGINELKKLMGGE